MDLLKEAMLSKVTTSKGFLIDGYPREVAQGIQFEAEINPCALVIYFEVSDDGEYSLSSFQISASLIV